MLSEKSRWCVVTHYKENYSLFPAFVSFYRRYYGIQRFFMLFGLVEPSTHDSLKKMISSTLRLDLPLADKRYRSSGNRELTVSEFVGKDFVLWAASHPAREFTPDSEFHNLRLDLNAWGETFLPGEISRTMVVDRDEFLYVKDPQMLESLECLGFHFLDVIPSPEWPPEELKFSLQGWYYRRQARPLFRYGKSFMTSVAKILGRGLDHDHCKTFYFDRKHWGNWTAWHHGTIKSLSCCFALNRYINDLNLCREILKNTACCYHLATTSKALFLTERTRVSSRVQTDLREENAGRSSETRDSNLAARSFDKFMKKSLFPIIEDNFLLPYLRVQSF